MKTGHLNLHTEITAVCSENHTKHNRLCGQTPNYSNFIHWRIGLARRDLIKQPLIYTRIRTRVRAASRQTYIHCDIQSGLIKKNWTEMLDVDKRC